MRKIQAFYRQVMRDIWFTFLTHLSVQFLMLSTVLCFVAVSLLDVWSYWPFALLVVMIAPFYEWVTHKYTLHLPLKQEAGFITVSYTHLRAHET